jgi:drug/metabolite transporter (DMT)-like permease
VSPAPARVWLAFAGVVVAWGSSYLFIRLAIDSFTPFGLVASRFCAASMLCAAIGRVRGERFPRGLEVARLALLGVMMMSGSNALTAYAQATIPSGITSVVHSLSAVWLAALGKEKLGGSVWLGVIGGVVGVALLLWPGQTHVDPLGASALVLAGWIFTFASMLQRKWQSGKGDAGIFSSLSVQMGAGGALSALIALLGPGFVHAPLTPSSLGGWLWLTVVSSCGGFAAYAIVLRNWPPARAGSFAVVNPVVSVLLGVVLLAEPFTARMAAGVAVTLAAVAWVQLRMGRAA